MTSTDTTPPPTSGPAENLSDETVSKVGDKVFSGLSFGAAALILVTLAAVAIFLFFQGLPTFGEEGDVLSESFLSFVGPLIFGTIYAAALALLIATPVAIAVALYISHYAPRRLATTLGYFIDLLAAIPSVVYGIWGFTVLAPIFSRSVFPWLDDKLSFLPFFGSDVNYSTSGRALFTVAIVLAVMVLPIITAISREVFIQTPRLHEEASLALGATRWEVVRMAVIPYGRSGVISGAMLGLGRALGETMAVAIILSPADGYFWNIITNSNSNTIAANIALRFPDSTPIEVNRLIATGLVLFVITFTVNIFARRIARAGFSGADG